MSERQYSCKIECSEGGISPGGIAEAIRWVEAAVTGAVAMAFHLRSSLRGAPDWLAAASRIELLRADVSPQGAELVFTTQALGESAEEYYRQPTLFWSAPDPKDTGFEVLGAVIRDIGARLVDSHRFDSQLLRRIGGLRRFQRYGVERVSLSGGRLKGRSAVVVDGDLLVTAGELSRETPAPVSARVMGTLDTIRASDASFILTLQGGERVPGLWLPSDRGQLGKLWGQRVVVEGTAIFRPSGALLRVEAKMLRVADDADQFFSVVPKGSRRTGRTQALRLEPTVDLAGWPGVEGDCEIVAGVRRLG